MELHWIKASVNQIRIGCSEMSEGFDLDLLHLIARKVITKHIRNWRYAGNYLKAQMTLHDFF